jgi:hypothetical protein
LAVTNPKLIWWVLGIFRAGVFRPAGLTGGADLACESREGRINTLIHRQLQKDGKVSLEDHEMMVYVNRQAVGKSDH